MPEPSDEGDAREGPERRETPLEEQRGAIEDAEPFGDLRRFLLHDPQRGEVVALGVEYPNGKVVLQNADQTEDETTVDSLQQWPDREKMLLHKPLTAEDIIWWDEPPNTR